VSDVSHPASPLLVHAAGALVWRERHGGLEVALVHRPRYQDWSWPKGKLEPGEAVTAAAVREVAEEIGVPVVLGVPLPTLRYHLPEGGTKQVRYWAAREAGQDDASALAARPAIMRASPDEIDDMVWVRPGAASRMLTRPTDRRPLEVLTRLWATDRLRTRLMAVARHGQARPRARWSGEEGDRPLTEIGLRQARALVPVLAAFGVRTVVSSPWQRCVGTAAPYVSASGTSVELVEALCEAGHAHDPGQVGALVTAELGDPQDAVIVTHRPVLPTVVAAIGESTRKWTGGSLPSRDPFLRTGELLVAHVAGTGAKARVVALEHHRPVRRPPAAG